MQFGLYLVRKGAIAPEQFVEALETQLASRPPLGALAIEYQKLSVSQVFGILREQAEDVDSKFGELALESRLLSENELASLLYYQSVRVKPMVEIIIEKGFLNDEAAHELWRTYRRTECQAQNSVDISS